MTNVFSLKSSNRGARFVHGGLPAYIRAQLFEASQGGSIGYRDAGFTFGRSLGHQCPRDAELDDWADELERLDSIIGDDAHLEQWLRATFPRIMEQVPQRRMAQFLLGIRRAHVEGWIAC